NRRPGNHRRTGTWGTHGGEPAPDEHTDRRTATPRPPTREPAPGKPTAGNQRRTNRLPANRHPRPPARETTWRVPDEPPAGDPSGLDGGVHDARGGPVGDGLHLPALGRQDRRGGPARPRVGVTGGVGERPQIGRAH